MTYLETIDAVNIGQYLCHIYIYDGKIFWIVLINHRDPAGMVWFTLSVCGRDIFKNVLFMTSHNTICLGLRRVPSK